MQGLTHIHHIQAAVELELANAKTDRRQVRGGIEKATALLLHDKGRLLALLVGVLRQHHHPGALAFGQQALVLQGLDQGLQVIVVETLATDVRLFEQQAQALEAQQGALRATEAWYRGIIEAAPDGMLVLGADGRILMTNPQMDTLFGYAPGELIGASIERLVPQAARERHVKLRDGFIASGGTRQMVSSLRALEARLPPESDLTAKQAGILIYPFDLVGVLIRRGRCARISRSNTARWPFIRKFS